MICIFVQMQSIEHDQSILTWDTSKGCRCIDRNSFRKNKHSLLIELQKEHVFVSVSLSLSLSLCLSCLSVQSQSRERIQYTLKTIGNWSTCLLGSNTSHFSVTDEDNSWISGWARFLPSTCCQRDFIDTCSFLDHDVYSDEATHSNTKQTWRHTLLWHTDAHVSLFINTGCVCMCHNE
jgi:hypothetical protein